MVSEKTRMTDEEQVALFLAAGASDEYRLATLGFEPDVIYDIGADVGSITMFAHTTYPNAKIIAVEPNPWSYPRLEANAADIPEIVPVCAAIGQGEQWQAGPDCPGPLHWMVVARDAPTWTELLVPSDVRSITLGKLYGKHGGRQYVVKLDIESAEYGIVTDPNSRQVILDSAYFAAEFHLWGTTHELMLRVVDTLMRFLFDLAQTHTIYTKHYGACIHVWATRRVDGAVEGGNGIIE